MKKHLIFTFLISMAYCSGSFFTFATNYYVAASGSDANNGTSAATPYRSINKINSITLQPGDQVLFKRGDVFRGQLQIYQSGTSASPITIDAYGNGNNPIISGAAVLSNWINVGNIWKTTCIEADSYISGVYANSISLSLGRFPNITETNSGYNTVQSHLGNTQITSQEALAINWTGGEIVLKTMQWILDKSTITSVSGNMLNFNATSYEPQDQWGYFIQNHPSTLDQDGEWYFNPITKEISVFLSQSNPNNQQMEATTFAKGIDLTGSYVTIQNIQIEKTRKYGVYGQNISYFKFLNSTVINSGENAIQLDGSGNFIEMINDSIQYVNNNAIVVNNYSNFVFNGNSVRNVGLAPGRGFSGDGQYFGLQYSANNSTGTSIIENCHFDSLGYVGIDFRASNIMVKKNIVSNYDLIKDDGGGIYTWNGGSPANIYTNQRVLSNIVYNAIGSTAGVYNGYPGACGIYMDDCSLNIEIADNTIFNCAGEGLMLHGTNLVNAHGNTVFNNGSQRNGGQFLINTSNCGQTQNLSIENNIFFSKYPYQEVSKMQHQTLNLSNYGFFDNNFYCRPFDENAQIITEFSTNGTNYDLDCWKTSGYGKDQNSQITPIQFKPYVINSYVGSNVFINGSFDSNIDGLYCWTPSSDCNTIWNNSVLDGGALQLTPGVSSPTFAVIGIGSVNTSNDYVLKYSLLGSDSCVSINTFLRQSGAPYSNLTPTISRSVKINRTENELLFSAPTSEGNASIVFSINSETGPVWIDNISLTRVNLTSANPSDSILFFYNDTHFDKSSVLPAGTEFIDVRGNSYTSSLTLPPFTSQILLYKDTSNVSLKSKTTTPNNLTIYPNPANLEVTLSYDLLTNSAVNFTIFDVIGNVVFCSKTENKNAGNHTLNVNVEQLKNSFYFVQMETDSGIISKKLVTK
jgi:Secretion system C-terminal sorting domain